MEREKLIRLRVCVTCQDEPVTWHEITECDKCYAITVKNMEGKTPCENWGHYYGGHPDCQRCGAINGRDF